MTFLKSKYLLSILFILGLILSFYAISLDDFLNLWDERFHALVAKNMINSPLMPTLYENPIVEMAYDQWDKAHIWLHKQPLFLWQIAFSMEIFGINEFAVRLPSAVMNSLLVLLAYSIGSMISNRKVGYITAFLYMTSFYILQLVSGRKELDHNDVAFLFYVSASIWAWLKYIKTGKFYWIILIGALSGAAILCKWLSGLLVYLAWGIFNMQSYRLSLKKYIPLLISLLITAMIVLPWQFLIFSLYPAEAKYELSYNFRHFSEVIEGHIGNFWFHLNNMRLLYGSFIQVLIFPALAVFYIKSKEKKLILSFLTMPIFVYLFYSLAATKMPSYPILVAIPIYICIAYLIYEAYEILGKKISIKWLPAALVSIIILTIAWNNLRVLEFNRLHAKDTNLAKQLTHNKRIFIGLNSELSDNTIIFNVKGRHYVECMFYTEFPTYNFIPSEKQYASLKTMEISIAVFKADQLPDYLTKDEDLIVIDKELLGYE